MDKLYTFVPESLTKKYMQGRFSDSCSLCFSFPFSQWFLKQSIVLQNEQTYTAAGTVTGSHGIPSHNKLQRLIANPLRMQMYQYYGNRKMVSQIV
jgi:hexokinase